MGITVPGPGDYERFPQNVDDPRDPRHVPQPPSEREVRERAAELAFDEFIATQEQFDEAMICNGEVEDVYPALRRALKYVHERRQWNNSGWMHCAIDHLERALKALQKLNTNIERRHLDAARKELDDE